MKLLATALLASTALATSVRWDLGYDDAGRSLNVDACSDGPNGLVTRKGWQTQGAVVGFPNIGSWEGIAGWNSPNCGACLSVSYGGRSITVVALDHAATGVVLSQAAMNTLTGGNAVQFGVVDAVVNRLDNSACGI